MFITIQKYIEIQRPRAPALAITASAMLLLDRLQLIEQNFCCCIRFNGGNGIHIIGLILRANRLTTIDR